MNKPVLFQNMPPLSPEEYSELETSIKEHGIQVPILIDEDGVVIDGHHRQKIAQELGIRCPKRQVIDKTESEKRTLALSLNVHRRHLTREQKRALIAESIKADPQLSDREHGRRLGVSKNTAASVREDLEAGGQIDHLEYRENPQGRPQPATKPKPKSDAELLAGAEWSPEPVEDDEPRFTDDHGRVQPITGAITGMDGKQYTRPEPKEPPKPRRRPIIDQARTVGWEVRKSVERIERILEDDRFNRNKEEVATQLRGHLQYAIEALTTALEEIN